MNKSTEIIFFSPTGTTKKISLALAEKISDGKISKSDITYGPEGMDSIRNRETLTIVAAPVYRGRIPELALKRMADIQSEGGPAVAVVVYGNREFDDALVELKDFLKARGFSVIAGAAFLGEHSFSTSQLPIAQDRPDSKDMETAAEFASKIKEKLNNFSDEMEEVTVPGNFPYKDPGDIPKLSPETVEESCTLCGKCVEICPSGAITISEKVETDKGKCIWCCACIKECPANARVFSEPKIKESTERLHINFSRRREPELFI